MRRWLAGLRQRVETTDDKGHHPLRLSRQRPHDLSGFHARVAANMALHTCCLWLKEPCGRPHLAFADLIDCSHGPISHQTFKY